MSTRWKIDVAGPLFGRVVVGRDRIDGDTRDGFLAYGKLLGPVR